MIFRALKCAFLTLALASGGQALAQELPEEAGPARTTKLFDLFCFNQLPNLAAIAKIAEAGEFVPIEGAELQKYQPAVPAEELSAWHFDDLAGRFVLIASKSKPDEKFKTDFPDFAESEAFACSLITPGADPSADVLAQMTEIMGRKPDAVWDQDPMKVQSWTGQTEKLLVNVYHYAAIKDGKTALLSASAFVKE